MENWNKQKLNSADIINLSEKYNFTKKFQNNQTLSRIFSSILLRKNITEGKDILYYIEEDLRFQHNPFLIYGMEDAVERILNAQEEKENVLIFGDSDVDGISSTAILYNQLKRMNINVQWRLPCAEDEEECFGLSKKAIEYCYSNDISLIITVDCGISNIEATAFANQLGIDVIITDHHNPQETLPDAIAVINPKHPQSLYPYHLICGAAVSYKLVSALRFAQTDFYNAEICFLNVNENKEENCYEINCAKIKNLVKIRELNEKIYPSKTSIYDLKTISFIQNQIIYVWDAQKTKKILSELFGNGIDFNFIDFSKEAVIIHPSLNSKTIEELSELSLIAKYIPEEKTIINSLVNLYTTYCKKIIEQKHKNHILLEKEDLQLVALASMADIMPMKNENRIFVKNGIKAIKENPCNGLKELLAKLQLDPQTLTSTDLSWTVIPCLNAAGRLKQPDIALNLLLEENPFERQKIAEKVYDLNEERKALVSNSVFKIHDDALKSLEKNQNKICVVSSKEIPAGLTGLIANRLMTDFQVPSIAVSEEDSDEKKFRGSIRIKKGLIATEFLSKFGNDFFSDVGGHDLAAGFSFESSKIDLFYKHIERLSGEITPPDQHEQKKIDAEIPPEYLNPEIFKIIDIFEPYGHENPELFFCSNNLILNDKCLVGKKEPFHLKLTFTCGNCKFPAMYWKHGDDINKFQINSPYNVIFTLNRNYFKGNIIPQMIIQDIEG